MKGKKQRKSIRWRVKIEGEKLLRNLSWEDYRKAWSFSLHNSQMTFTKKIT